MTGDSGPYIDPNGPDVWVPRTVPYLDARKVAREAVEYDERLVYVGKSDATLFGFSRDCDCYEVCELAGSCRVCRAPEGDCEHDDPEDWDICRVPAWHFRRAER